MAAIKQTGLMLGLL